MTKYLQITFSLRDDSYRVILSQVLVSSLSTLHSAKVSIYIQVYLQLISVESECEPECTINSLHRRSKRCRSLAENSMHARVSYTLITNTRTLSILHFDNIAPFAVWQGTYII